jgi:hypothetical protein
MALVKKAAKIVLRVFGVVTGMTLVRSMSVD